jgi:hypothetical protein
MYGLDTNDCVGVGVEVSGVVGVGDGVGVGVGDGLLEGGVGPEVG